MRLTPFLWRPPQPIEDIDTSSPCCSTSCRVKHDHVRFWHLADIDADDEHVCFWGVASGLGLAAWSWTGAARPRGEGEGKTRTDVQDEIEAPGAIRAQFSFCCHQGKS